MFFELLSISIILFLPYLFLYTEMHYRFAIPFSRYYKDEPEILSDIPHRINPNNLVPVMILVKDADK